MNLTFLKKAGQDVVKGLLLVSKLLLGAGGQIGGSVGQALTSAGNYFAGLAQDTVQVEADFAAAYPGIQTGVQKLDALGHRIFSQAMDFFNGQGITLNATQQQQVLAHAKNMAGEAANILNVPQAKAAT